jgi:hypothetical protein
VWFFRDLFRASPSSGKVCHLAASMSILPSCRLRARPGKPSTGTSKKPSSIIYLRRGKNSSIAAAYSGYASEPCLPASHLCNKSRK